MEKPQEPEVDLEAEYRRLSDGERIYHDKIDLWIKLQRIALYLTLILIFIVSFLVGFLPQEPTFLEMMTTHPLQFYSFAFALFSLLFSFSMVPLMSGKISRIRSELRVSKEERLFLRAYETYKSIHSYMNESNPNRKVFFKKMALVNAEKTNRIVDGWDYGNIGLIKELVGDQIDLFKNNFRRLVLSNIAEGDETALGKIAEILIKFCKYIHSPSIEEFNELNSLISGLKYRKYKVLTRQERIGEYFYSKPRAFRLLFASTITIIVVSVLLYLNQNIGLIVAVGVTCFWGAFTGFDKLFRLEKK